MLGHFPQREHGVEDLADQLGDTATFRWGVGVCVPLVMCVGGAWQVASHSANFGGNHGNSIALHGLNATTLGIAWICGGLFTHCRMFWGSLVTDHWLVTLGELLSAAGGVLALITIVVRVGLLNLR